MRLIDNVKHLLADIPRHQFIRYSKEELINVIISAYEQIREFARVMDDFVDNVNNGNYKGKDGLNGLDGAQGEKGDKGDKGDVGEKGDPGKDFTYEDFTPEQINQLKGPAIEGKTLAEQAASNANQKALEASTAIESVNSALTNLNVVLTEIESKVEDVDTTIAQQNASITNANTKASNAETTANSTISIANNAKTIADTANSKSDQAQSVVSECQAIVNQNRSEIFNSDGTSKFQDVVHLETTEGKQNLVATPSNPSKFYNKTEADSKFATKEEVTQTMTKVTPLLSTGTAIATVKEGNETKTIYAPADVSTTGITTPSGNPMHNVYLKLGCVWNATTQFWELNGLTDITNDEMDIIFAEMDNSPYPSGKANSIKGRTYICNFASQVTYYTASNMFRSCNNIEVIRIGSNVFSYFFVSSLVGTFDHLPKLKKILSIIKVNQCTTTSKFSFSFKSCPLLSYLRLEQLLVSIDLSELPSLDNDSILFMLIKAINTTAITITLHADAYARAIADESIVAKASEKNITLLSA